MTAGIPENNEHMVRLKMPKTRLQMAKGLFFGCCGGSGGIGGAPFMGFEVRLMKRVAHSGRA
jgi:hypothetical protein